MHDDTVAAVLEKLGVERPAPDLDGLRAVYAAWCGAVAFDNVLKLIHLADERSGPLPGSTAESFFEAWLEHGTGGTCWSGNGALHDLLEALGFDVARAIATMLSSPERERAEPRLRDRDRRRRALDRRRLDPQRRADPHPRRGRARGRGPASPVRVARHPPCRRLADGDRARGLPVPDRAHRGRRDANGTSATSARATGARSTTSSTRGCCGVGRASASPGASATRWIRTARSRRASSTRTSVSSFSSRSSASPRRSPSRCPTTGRCRRARDPIGQRSRPDLTRRIAESPASNAFLFLGGGCRARDADTTPDRSSRPLAGRVAPRLSPNACVASVTNAVPQPTTTAGGSPPRLATWSNGREGGGACTTSPRHGCC